MKNRKKSIIFGILLIIGGITLSASYFVKPNQQAGETYEIRKVVDGDTIEIKRYGRTETVRLIGVDTPETVDPRKPVQCYGREAADYSKKLMTGKRVKLESDPLVGERDKYNRLLAYVWLDQNQLVNQMLVAGGYAHEYTYRSQVYKYQQQFKDAQTSAKENGVGLWASTGCKGKTK